MSPGKISINAEALKRLMEKTAEAAEAKSTKDSIDDVEDLATRKSRAEIDGIEQKNANVRANRTLRSGYANKVFCYLIFYSIFVAVVLILSGFNICDFKLPDAVLSFLVGSTAAAAIGLVYSVSSGLFKDLNQ